MYVYARFYVKLHEYMCILCVQYMFLEAYRSVFVALGDFGSSFTI